MAITVVGGAVTVTAASGISNLEYNLLGTSAAGSLTLSSTTRATFVLNNLNLTNASGPAIRITGGQTHTFVCRAGTSNALTDGTANTRDGALQTNGKLILSGTGSLTVKGLSKHGISTSGAIELQSSNVTVTSAVSDGFHSEGFTMSGGTATVSASSSDGIDAGDGAIAITSGTINGGTESNDNSQLNISGGILIVAGSDAIDSNGNITITGGTTVVCGSTSQPEEGIDYNGTFLINGGILISGGSNSSMTKAMGAASTQVSMYLKSSAVLASTSVLHIENAAGTEMVTFKPKNNVYYFHFSSPALAQSTQYKVYFGGTYTGGNFVGNTTGWGMYTGGSYSLTGATLKTTFTTSATAKLNTVSF